MRRNRIVTNLSAEDKVILEDKTLTNDVVCFMLDLPMSYVKSYRYRKKYSESLRKASARKREEIRQKNKDRFGKAHACYNYWTDEEIEYLLRSTETDEEIALKLNRTSDAIRQKRNRVQQRRRR